MEIEGFKQEVQCTYKDEKYSVRDNGAILRHHQDGKRPRKNDNVWTYGAKNEKNGYMYIGSHRVHIIIATAFYGERDSKVYVVDHLDTNHCNNRIENLRWLTRLENALMNPVTLKRITFLCGGDIIKFIKDPSCLQDLTGTNKDLEWMRVVSADEAKKAYVNIMAWAQSTNSTTPSNDYKSTPGWELETENNVTQIIDGIDGVFTRADFPTNALQMNWRTPTKFLCCPINVSNNPIKSYIDNLQVGKTFSSNQYGCHSIVDRAIIENNSAIVVLTHNEEPNPIKGYAIARIWSSGGQFIHEGIQTFFSESGALKQFTLLQGIEWTGEDSVDDYC